MSKTIKYSTLTAIILLTVVLIIGIFMPNQYESELTIPLPVNSGTAFRVLSQLENYPVWYLLYFNEKEHLTWISGVDGTKGAILNWETSRNTYHKGQTRISNIQPLKSIELISHSEKPDSRLILDQFFIEVIDHQNVNIRWTRRLTLQFPYNILFRLQNPSNSTALEHRRIKDQFYKFFFENFSLLELYGQSVRNSFRNKTSISVNPHPLNLSEQFPEDKPLEGFLHFMNSEKGLLLFYGENGDLDEFYFLQAKFPSGNELEAELNLLELPSSRVIELDFNMEFPITIETVVQFKKYLYYSGYQIEYPIIVEGSEEQRESPEEFLSFQWVIYIN